MADITAIRKQIAKQIETEVVRHDGKGLLYCSHQLLLVVNPPAASVGLGAFDWDDKQPGRSGMDEVPMRVTVYAGTTETGDVQDALDAYLATSGVSSIKAALERNRKLLTDLDDPTSKLCDRLRVLGTTDPRVETVAGADYLVADVNTLAICPPDRS